MSDALANSASRRFFLLSQVYALLKKSTAKAPEGYASWVDWIQVLSNTEKLGAAFCASYVLKGHNSIAECSVGIQHFMNEMSRRALALTGTIQVTG